MTPRQFLKRYSFDRRMVDGSFFSPDPLVIDEEDTVGVVLVNLGGPESPEDVEPFLYNLFMDPAIIDIPVGGIFRHGLCKVIARLRAKKVAKDYEMIGGGSPLNRLTEEQASCLERKLNKCYGEKKNVKFRTYMAMRYWHPFSEEAAEEMQEDEVDKVVLLPLYPQYSKTTTGASLAYWNALEEAGEIPHWPTTYTFEYSANPKYLQALSERIDEGLQRFSRDRRREVQLLFSAHGTPLKEMKERRDPYCCLIHSTVDQLMKYRRHDRPYHIAFQSKVGPSEWLTPSTPDKLEELARYGHEAVLVVPVAFVTDHIETSYELDIEVREEAEEAGIEAYEVTSGLNSHPLFIEALAEATLAQLEMPGAGQVIGLCSNGSPSKNCTYPLRPLNRLPRFSAARRQARCHQCECITEARRWDSTPTEAQEKYANMK